MEKLDLFFKDASSIRNQQVVPSFTIDMPNTSFGHLILNGIIEDEYELSDDSFVNSERDVYLMISTKTIICGGNTTTVDEYCKYSRLEWLQKQRKVSTITEKDYLLSLDNDQDISICIYCDSITQLKIDFRLSSVVKTWKYH